MEAFDEFLEKNEVRLGKVLDVGCRDKCLKEALEQRGFEWTGIDPSPQGGDILVGKMESMDVIPDESYDLVFVCHAFEHCERPVDALREFKRVLKKGGWLFIATPFPCDHHILRADEDHIMCLDTRQMMRLLIYTGWEILNTWTHSGNIEQNNTIVSIARK